jgi:hypothetical protein
MIGPKLESIVCCKHLFCRPTSYFPDADRLRSKCVKCTWLSSVLLIATRVTFSHFDYCNHNFQSNKVELEVCPPSRMKLCRKNNFAGVPAGHHSTRVTPVPFPNGLLFPDALHLILLTRLFPDPTSKLKQGRHSRNSHALGRRLHCRPPVPF